MLVNYLVVCPYCKTDNKVRECAYHCICYRCKNRWSLRKPEFDKEELNKKPNENEPENNYYKYDAKTGIVYPPDKSLRFSDLMYPDPLFYPGFYPVNSLSPLYPNYFSPYNDCRYKDRMNRMLKYGFQVYKMNDQSQSHIPKIYNKFDVDKVDLMYKLKEIDRKVDKMMNENLLQNSKSCNYYKGYNNNNDKNDFLNNNNDKNDFLNNKMKSVENTFFMK